VLGGVGLEVGQAAVLRRREEGQAAHRVVEGGRAAQLAEQVDVGRLA
jgi:hypothetical protein